MKNKNSNPSPLELPIEEQTIKHSLENMPKANVLTPDEIIGEENTTKLYDGKSALDMLKERMKNAAENAKVETVANNLSTKQPITAEVVDQTKHISLLDKCQPYTVDEDGNSAVNSEPLYKLATVAEILKSDSEKLLENLSKKYDTVFEEIDKKSAPTTKFDKPKKEPDIKTKTQSEKEIFEEPLTVSSNIKNIQTSVPFVISDIDNTFIAPVRNADEKKLSDTATITFTPIYEGENRDPRLSVSTHTRPIDLTGELSIPETSPSAQYDEPVKLEKDEFDDYIPDLEYKNPKDAKKFVRLFSLKKRNAFICSAISVLVLILLLFIKLPFISNLILSASTAWMIAVTAITSLSIIANIDMFSAFAKILSKKSSPDVAAALASISVIAYAIFGIVNDEIITDILLLLSLILAFRAVTKFFKASYTLSNFILSCSSNTKTAMRLIDDTAVTFAMAKNTIDGDALIAVPQKCNHLEGFMKFSTFGVFLGGKLPIISISSVLLAIMMAFACSAYFDSLLYGLYASSAVLCYAALPNLFLIDILPLYRTSKKLNKRGAGILGKAGANHIECANAVVFDSLDIFPEGTITLHQMKVLSDNNLDDTLIRAASLSQALNSTLAPIFKTIAGSGEIKNLPDCDTIKYEDRMGISGWVDNRLLFIGNRTLMEAHGIEVPSVEVDRKILRNGYFPVYVATQSKACALLMIQYNVDNEIAKELRKLTRLGVTVLINNSDPNLTEEMICDYLGLYGDAVKVMSAAGCHMYKNATAFKTNFSAPAFYRKSSTIANIINCASRIKKANTLLSVSYIISAVMGNIIFAYYSFTGTGALLGGTSVLLYSVICTIISYLLYLIQRP